MKKSVLHVKTNSLLAIAGTVWLIASFNVTRLGILAYQQMNQIQWFHYASSVVIFLIFGMMFYNMTRKHEKRIASYQDRYKPFWYFFDIKSYIIMAVMMSGGIYLRNSHLVKDAFIAYFYTGLGIALGLAGVVFWLTYFKNKKA